ncbi:hypothetical protein EM868_09165 [Cupriavidus gilardii]|uniref:hypothetical protein n=1 Tax=Cupriavidus gilardii TaxID=82541 RepID=UPI001ABDA7AB|nr:hypothetical protein [Cupriavidus gilardii]MBO4119873.1 hypothetical protein [Cupriavidus gilardii]MCG5259775.1 hypothetical protein [Cupriavidus gilardii]MDF9429966.1 hypothetical protein [Cupriavidus gilardii]
MTDDISALTRSVIALQKMVTALQYQVVYIAKKQKFDDEAALHEKMNEALTHLNESVSAIQRLVKDAK